MRARNIKPGFFTNDALAEIEPIGRILFAGLWMVADREGRLEDRPKRIKAEVLPYDDCDVESTLDQLQTRGFILRFQIAGSRYIQVLNFRKHQRPHSNEAQSCIPPPQELVTLEQSPVNQGEQSEQPRKEGLRPDTGLSDCLIDDSGLIDSANAPQKPKRAASLPDDFVVTDEMTNWAFAEQFTYQDIEQQTALFRDHFKANGKPMKDWPATWRNWMRRSRTFARAPKTANGFGPKGPDAAYFAKKALELERQGR